MVELQPSKLVVRVRFPSPAPRINPDREAMLGLAPVAQRTEQEPSKLLVGGSNPPGGAARLGNDRSRLGLFCPHHGGRSSAWLERLVVVQEVGGSNPLGHPGAPSRVPKEGLAGFRSL